MDNNKSNHEKYPNDRIDMTQKEYENYVEKYGEGFWKNKRPFKLQSSRDYYNNLLGKKSNWGVNDLNSNTWINITDRDPNAPDDRELFGELFPRPGIEDPNNWKSKKSESLVNDLDVDVDIPDIYFPDGRDYDYEEEDSPWRPGPYNQNLSENESEIADEISSFQTEGEASVPVVTEDGSSNDKTSEKKSIDIYQEYIDDLKFSSMAASLPEVAGQIMNTIRHYQNKKKTPKPGIRMGKMSHVSLEAADYTAEGVEQINRSSARALMQLRDSGASEFVAGVSANEFAAKNKLFAAQAKLETDTRNKEAQINAGIDAKNVEIDFKEKIYNDKNERLFEAKKQLEEDKYYQSTYDFTKNMAAIALTAKNNEMAAVIARETARKGGDAAILNRIKELEDKYSSTTDGEK